jgi:DNA mismatch repair protein MutL
VDINVHPAKAEIRFTDSQAFFQLILHSIEKALLKKQGIKEVYPAAESAKQRLRIEDGRRERSFLSSERKQEALADILPSPEEKEEGIFPRILGQYQDTYIVATLEEGILIIDQHNAHERVLFEKYQDIDKKKKWPRKMVLFPVLLELSPSQLLGLEENQTVLEDAGFRVEAMSGRSISLKEFPDLFREQEAKEIFLALLEDMRGDKVKDKKERLLATLACKTAVKAGQALSFEKMAYLVEELFKTSNSSLCPHGRPIIVKIERREIEKGLKRE